MSSGKKQIHERGNPCLPDEITGFPLSLSTTALRNEKGEIVGAIETFHDLSDLERLRKQISLEYTYEDIVGRHPGIKDILSLLPDIAESDSPVLITGPTGSGKELFARAIHNLSSRKDGPFVPVNCAVLPDTRSCFTECGASGIIGRTSERCL
jgi:transcriptional regulator with PAS, ATPase and Fis domain